VWNGSVQLTRELSAFYTGRYDLALEEDRMQAAGLAYGDECTQLRIFWERENIDIGNLGPSTAVKFELVLFTLGGIAED
jgi:LPS-assembly protein